MRKGIEIKERIRGKLRGGIAKEGSIRERERESREDRRKMRKRNEEENGNKRKDKR